MAIFPLFNLDLFALEHSYNSIVLSLDHSQLRLVISQLTFNIFQPIKLHFSIWDFLLPLLDLIKLISESIVQSFNLSATYLKFARHFLIVVYHLSYFVCIIFQTRNSDLPFIDLTDFVFEICAKLFVFVLPLALLSEELIKFKLSLFGAIQFFLFFFKNLIKPI